MKSGRYGIRAWRGGKIFAGKVDVAVGEERVVRAESLAPAGSVSTASKGGEAPAPSPVDHGRGWWHGRDRRWHRRRARDARRAGHAVGLVGVDRRRLALSIVGGDSFRETQLFALAGYRRGIGGEHWHAWAGVEAGVGVVAQTGLMPDEDSVAAKLGVLAGTSYDVASGIKLVLEPTLDAQALRRDGKESLVAIPGVWLGLGFAL